MWQDLETGPASPAGTLVIRPLSHGRGLLLHGEADINSRPVLRAALRSMTDRPHHFDLELAGLRFIDVCCTREIVAFTECHPGMRVTLHHPPPGLLRITSLVWPEANLDVTGRTGRSSVPRTCWNRA